MSKLLVVGPKSKLAKVVGELHDLRSAHIVEHKKDEFDLCMPLQSFEKISGLLVQTRSLLSALQVSGVVSDQKGLKLPDVEKCITTIKREVSSIIDAKKKIEDELALTVEQKKLLGQCALLGVQPQFFYTSSYIASYFGFLESGQASRLRKKLENITNAFELLTAEQKNGTLIALFVDAAVSDEAEKALAEASFSETNVSPVTDFAGKPAALAEQLSKKEQKLGAQLAELNTKWRWLGEKHGTYLSKVEKFLSREADKGQAPLSFGSTREAFFLRCFVPASDSDVMKGRLEKAAGGALHVMEEELGDEEDVPIKLKNPRPLRPFEFFTNLYSLPKYNEFDPTMLMAFTFPLFFGFMLGDVGYGLITLALFYYLKRRFPVGKEFFNILMVASVAAILFGALYGEVFGYEPWHGIIVRTHDFNTLMVISIIAGVVQVNFGLLLGFILELRHHNFMYAVYHKLSWVFIQLGIVLFLGPVLKLLSVPALLFYTGMASFFLGGFLLYKGEGILGLIEIPTILTHIMSYARLMAVGLASVFIAVMVNDLVTFLWHKGVWWIPLAIVALVVGHLFNIALGILSPSLHSIRLHYVEFFTKFYRGGGKEYVPFGAERQKSLL
jgi:V/A-type H+-transporting ATPase subunit I